MKRLVIYRLIAGRKDKHYKPHSKTSIFGTVTGIIVIPSLLEGPSDRRPNNFLSTYVLRRLAEGMVANPRDIFVVVRNGTNIARLDRPPRDDAQRQTDAAPKPSPPPLPLGQQPQTLSENLQRV